MNLFTVVFVPPLNYANLNGFFFIILSNDFYYWNTMIFKI